MHWTFVGGGNMAASLVGGMLAAGAEPGSLRVVDPDAGARERVTSRFGIAALESVASSTERSAADDAAGAGRGFVVAVKPDIVERACRDIASASGDDENARPLVVSVAAGVRLDALERWLAPATPIVRCMPNTPALLGLGATGYFANGRCGAAERTAAESLLGGSGFVVEVPEEAALDAVTATSGSGPAYVFYLIEQMARGGERLGLDADVARDLAIETAFGAASMARAREATPAELRRRVTSKGGTTAAAIAAFDAAGFPATVLAAMRAAHERAVELGDEHVPD